MTSAAAWATRATSTMTAAAAVAASFRSLRFAHFAKNLADAFSRLFTGDGCGTRRQLPGNQQVGLDCGHRDFLFDERLDLRQTLRVALAGEADRVAFRTQSRGAADAVHIVLGIERQIVVVDVRNAIDMQSARSDIGSDQDIELAFLELAQQRFAPFLRHIAGQHADPKTRAFQRTCDAFDPDLGVDEHHRAAGFAARQQSDQQRNLFLVGREIHQLAHRGIGDEFGFDDQFFRLVHVLVSELQHAMRERRRKQQRLSLLAAGHASQQKADVLDEAQVEHAVGFVEHTNLASVQRDDFVLLDVIDQPARGGDDHVGAALQQLALLVVVDTAIDQREFQAEIGAEFHRVLVDLDCQLAGRRQDQGARVFGFALGQRWTREQAIDHRDQERQCLAGASLRLAGDIAAG